MKNVLYGVDDNTGAQIDVTDIAILNTVVAQVSDADGNVYPGDQVTLITDRDFLYVPDLDQSLSVGDQIYLDNQSHQRWEVKKGWYSVDDNPAIYGYYLSSIPAGKTRSLFLKDFNSLTFVTPKTQFTLPTILTEEDEDNA
jgi:hypothetical protein